MSCIVFFRYATAKHVVGYEVRTGSISANRVYQGLALREEEVVNSEYSGYINYYSSETERLSAGSLAYTVDESGQIQSYLAQNTDNAAVFSDKDYAELSSDIVSFEESFEPSGFHSVYDFKETFSEPYGKSQTAAFSVIFPRFPDLLQTLQHVRYRIHRLQCRRI